jgi:flagellar L-ring protein precursor FlgH
MRTLRRLLCAVAGGIVLASAGAQSLYSEHSWRPLTGDHKAHRVGDVLTVQVLESSSATTSADTGTRRNNRLDAELSHRATSVAQTSITAGGEFDGGGRTQRASRLLITVTVTVQEVLAGGVLRIAGAQSIKVNEELQQVTLEGLVRSSDISDANVVLSTRIADARITYVGEGDVSDRSRRPWWRRLADAVGL